MSNRPASRSADLTGHTDLLQTSLRILIALALAMLSLPFLSTSASAAPIVGGFDIDGTAPSGAPTAADATDTKTTPDDIFIASKEEGDPPTTWGLRWGKADTGGDITSVYTDDDVDTNGDVWFYFGFARAELGTGAFVVELNQNPNVPVLDSKDPLLNLTVPDRSVGDVRITFNQPDGNTNLQDVGADKWTGTAWADAPGFAYTSATNASGLFGEMAVNLTDSGLLPVCGNDFTAVNVRSRASSQEAAELKDYVKALGVSISDERCRSIRVEKYDANNTNAPLGGASFQLFRDDGDDVFDAGDTQVGTPTSQESADEGVDGNNYTWNDLPWGTYFVKESTRPVGYEIDPDANADNTANTFDDHVQKVTLGASTPNGIAVVRFENPQTKAQIRVEKYDASNANAPLTGAQFRLYQDDGDGTFEPNGDTPIGTEVTADQGPAPSNNTYTWPGMLEYGTYFVEESGRPAGYDVDPDATGGARLVNLRPADAGNVVPVGFYNPQYTPQIRVAKYDTAGVALEGAEFRLLEDTNDSGLFDSGDLPVGASVPADQGADNNSYTWSAGLSWGDYFVQETGRPTGYNVDPTASTDPGFASAKRVTVSLASNNGLATVDFNNPRMTAQIQVVKKDLDTLTALPGASFTLYDDDGSDPGVWDAGDSMIGSQVPADQGAGFNTYIWSNLTWGDYIVRETGVPDGYNADTSADDDGGKLVHIGAAQAGTTVTVDFYNQKTPTTPLPESTIVVTKTDIDLPAGSNKIDGATFRLHRDVNNDGVADADEELTIPVDHSGVGTYEWSDLPVGSYLVKEADPPHGYLSPSADSLPADDTEAVTIDETNAGATFEVGFENQQKKNTVVANKYDAEQPTTKIDGAIFELYLDVNTNGSVDTGDQDQGPPVRTGTGTYEWDNLLAGQYLVVEAAPPGGYLAPASPVRSVTLTDGANESVDYYNAPKKTEIVVTKRDATTNQPIDTATFQLWEDANANGTFEAAVDAKVSPAKNTANGVVSWVGLLMGTYFVEETAAPNGYELPANTVLTILVDANNAGGTLERSFYDLQKRTTIELVKRDDDTNQVLAGAGFQAYVDVNEDGEFDGGDTPIGGPKTSDANGVVSWSGLEFGHYVIREVTAPDNYGLATDSEQAVVLGQDNAGGTVQLVFLDPAQGVVSIVKVALEKDAAGRWVPSDGETAFGDLVKYRITANAYGAKMYRDVRVSDFIPGYDPADTKSTTKVSYVPGSATCGLAATCPVTFQADEQELTWSLGDMQAVERTLRFVVRMPALPVAPVYEDGVLIKTVVNVAELSWQADAPESTQRLAGAYGNQSIRSNEVITTIVDQPEVLDTPPAERPETVKRPGALLPDTGAPAHGVLFGTVGSLSLLLGAWLMLVSRGRGYLPQR